MIVTDERVPQFAAENLCGFVAPFTCMGLELNGRIVAAAIFNHYEETDIHMSAVGKRWTRGFVREVGSYVFGQLGCLRMTSITEQPEVAALAVRLGGCVEGRLRNHFGPGRDGILIGFLKEEWVHGLSTKAA